MKKCKNCIHYEIDKNGYEWCLHQNIEDYITDELYPDIVSAEDDACNLYEEP